MKIKHFMGYGCVNAKKVLHTDDTLVIEVKGSHEYGLVCNDTYDAFNWLVKKFDKSRTYDDVSIIEHTEDYDAQKREDVVTYSVYFKR